MAGCIRVKILPKERKRKMILLDKDKIKLRIKDAALTAEEKSEFTMLINSMTAEKVHITKNAEWFFSDNIFWCSYCGDREQKERRYCPGCGAKMKRG